MTAKKSASRKKGGSKSTRAKGIKKVLHSLPGSLENMKVVQSAANLVEGVQEQAKGIKKDATDEFGRFAKKFGTSFRDIESLVNTVGAEAVKQAQKGMNDLVEKYKKAELPGIVKSEVDKVLNQMGLRRKRAAKKAKPAATKRSQPKKAAATKKRAAAKKSASARTSPKAEKPSEPKSTQ